MNIDHRILTTPQIFLGGGGKSPAFLFAAAKALWHRGPSKCLSHMEGRNIWGPSPDIFGERNAPPGLVLSSAKGLFTTPDLNLLTFATGEEMAR